MDLHKLLNWKRQIPNYYECKQSVLITSGCSFTDSTNQTEYAVSWPGFVKDRCNFDYCIDISYTGAGNLYIKESIEHAVEHLAAGLNPVVLVMWSGLQRYEEKVIDSQEKPYINNISYKRTGPNFITGKAPVSRKRKSWLIERSAQLILDLASFLEQKNISYAFTSYVNLLHPPYIHCLDPTYRFTDHKDKKLIAQIEKLFLPISGQDYLYDFAFIKDGLLDDDFHPDIDPILDWTDQILLPSLEQKGIIKSKQ